MNYTDKYHLPQWVKSDRIMMDDFNQMCRDMEAGLDKTISKAAELDAAVANAAQKAQSTANKAVADAANAQAKADAAYAPDQPPYTVGTYRGNGSSLTLNLGFRPRFVIVSGGTTADSTICVGAQTCSTHLQFTDTGFTVASIPFAALEGEYPPYICMSGYTYCYIAFR